MSWINKIKDKSNLIFGFFIMQFFLMSDTLAFGFPPPPSSDLSVAFINQIFTGLTGGGGINAFGGSVGVFNGAILAVGGILAAYTILAGTLGTAHDGEMLGKKFSSVWIPIRYALGTALVLPILSGGYCVMQALVMWVIMQGITVGNMAWKEYVQAPPLKTTVSAKSTDEMLKLVTQIYLANVCVEANKKALKDADEKTAGYLSLILSADYKYAKNGEDYRFGDYKTFSQKSNCGEITVPKVKPIITTSTATSGGASKLTSLENVFTSVDTTPIRLVHLAQIALITSETSKLAVLAIDNPASVSFSSLQVLADNYAKAIQTSADAVLAAGTTSTNMATAATNQGWFMAGTWFTKIINMQNTINAGIGDVPSAVAGISSPTITVSSNANKLMANGHRVTSEYSKISAAFVANPTGEKSPDANKSTKTDWFGDVAESIAKAMTSLELRTLKDDARHPIILMSDIGNHMVNFFLNLLILSGGTLFVLGLVPGLGDSVITVATMLATFLFAPLAVLFTTGITLAYVLPNLPLLIWMGIIIGWVIMIVEAIIAAPLWAIMHLHPNGDDLTGRGGNGYMLVLGLLLRPVLIIFGFISAIVLSGLFGEFVNKIFFETFASSQLGGTMGFFSIIAGTALYAVIMYTVLIKTLNLMHVIPDQLMKWVGGGQEQLGQYAGGFSGEGMAKAGAAVGAVSGYASSGGINNATQGMQQMNQARIAKQGADAQKAGNLADKIRNAKQESASDKQASSAIGSDAGSVHSSIDKNNGGDEQKSAKEKNQFAQTSEALGGSGSTDAASYRNSVATQMEDGKSFDDAHKSALSSAVDEKFGSGSFGAVTTLAGKNPSGAKLNAAMGTLSKTQNNLQSMGMSPDESKSAMSGIISKATSETQKNGGAGFGANLQAASNEVKSSVGGKGAGGNGGGGNGGSGNGGSGNGNGGGGNGGNGGGGNGNGGGGNGGGGNGGGGNGNGGGGGGGGGGGNGGGGDFVMSGGMLGGGGDSVPGLIDKNNSQGGPQSFEDEIKSFSEKTQFAETSNALGGPGSAEAASYGDSVATQMEGGSNFSTASERALSSTLDGKFGNGSFGAAQTLSGGSTSGPKFNSAIATLSKTRGDFESMGMSPEQSKSAMSRMISKATTATHIDGEFQSFESKLDGGSNSFGANLQAASNEIKVSYEKAKDDSSKQAGAEGGRQSSNISSSSGKIVGDGTSTKDQ